MDSVKSYSDFEKEVDPHGDARAEPLIIQFGFPGSGSTFVWQVLNSILGNVKKTHKCPQFRPEDRVVVTVRDFRDILCTYFKRANLPVTKASIDFLVNEHAEDNSSFSDLYRVSETWGDRKNVLWLRYEDFFGNFDYLFGQIEKFFGMKLTDEQKARARSSYSLEANKARSERVAVVCRQEGGAGWIDEKWQAYTIDGINGLHVTGDGSVGKWRQIIPKEWHGYVNELLAEPLKRYGYPLES
ncbi:sulfotransferase domain-containing protein [Myxococcus faecalis]|uniref:sulfotransferase domain-containing protein n=1 Tax=Myxococcus faecalis TaxID=3115646 RepID=UPI0038D24D5E